MINFGTKAAFFTMEDVLGTLALRTGHKPKKLKSQLKRCFREQYNLPLTNNGKRLCLFRLPGTVGVDLICVGLLDRIESDEAVELIPWHSQSAGHWLDNFIKCFPLPEQKRPNRGCRNPVVRS